MALRLSPLSRRDGAQRCDVNGDPVMPVSSIDKLAAAIRLLELSIRKGPARVAAEAQPLVDQAKEVLARQAVAMKAPSEPIERVGQGGRPILSLKARRAV
jgi:hypothetical protein